MLHNDELLNNDDYEVVVKVVIVGNGAVGKSSMIQRYCKGNFTTSYKKTIGVDFLEKHITASGEDVRLMLWDTAGQEEFDAITKAYYRGAQACVIVFSTSDRASFEAVKSWKRKVEDECGHVPMVLVQNKIDLLHESQVDSFEVEKFARNTGLQFIRTSVKENLNISHVFYHLAEKYVESISRWSDESPNAIYQIDERQTEVRVRFAGLPNGNSYQDSEDVDNRYRKLYLRKRKKMNFLRHQFYPNPNMERSKISFETPVVVNRFYFHDPTYSGSAFISPDQKIKLLDKKNCPKDNNNKPCQTFAYYSCNRLLTITPGRTHEKDSSRHFCRVL